jgi:hypothetical protein
MGDSLSPSLSHTHTLVEGNACTTMFGVVVTHAHKHTLLLKSAYIYVLSRLCSVTVVVHVQKELLPRRPLGSPQVLLSPADAECFDSHVD